MNKHLNLSFGALNGDVLPVDECQLVAVKSFKDALKLCITLSRVKRTQQDLALQAGINPTQFSKVIRGDFHLPEESIIAIERLCGNCAMPQWLAMQHGATLHIKTVEERLAVAEAKLAQYERAA